MLLIVNISKEDVCIKDLGITLKASQAIDMDKFKIPRSKSIYSKDLNNSINNKLLRILKADPPLNVTNIEEPTNTVIIQKVESKTIDKDIDYSNIRTIVEDEIKKHMTSSFQIENKLEKIMGLLERTSENNNIIEKNLPNDNVLDNIDIKKLEQIHIRNLNKQSESLKSTVKYSETKTESEIDTIADELSDLI